MRSLTLPTLVAVLLVLTLLAWFGGWPPGLPPAVPAVALLAAVAWRLGPVLRTQVRDHRWLPRPETGACLLLALAYRWPALVHPWGFVNRDGAYGAFIALHLLEGVRPAPVFTEGANYQGSLKGHLAALFALVTGSRDLSWLIVLASVLLYLVFVAASMALARRIAGRGAALVTGLYLALSPKFLTTFSLNSVGQYVDVLALGGCALLLVARVDASPASPASPRAPYFGIGLLLGAAFWQQPVALAYVVAAVVALALRRRATWRDPAVLLLPAGLAVGALPVLIWNVQNGWATGGLLARDPWQLLTRAEILPLLVAETSRVAFPILAGLSPGHPAAPWPAVRAFATLLLPLVVLVYLLAQRTAVVEGLRGRRVGPLLPLLLAAVNLALFFATTGGSVNRRPRYLLPFLAASAIMLGAVAAWGFARARLAALAAVVGILALNVSGTLPRLRQSAAIEEGWRQAVRSLEEMGIRTGYSDVTVAGAITMFTAEHITLSARLGPTPAYNSDRQDERVAREGPDAYVLAPGDDTEAFRAALARLRVTCRYDPEPFPTFWQCSRRVRLEEVDGFRGEASVVTVDEE